MISLLLVAKRFKRTALRIDVVPKNGNPEGVGFALNGRDNATDYGTPTRAEGPGYLRNMRPTQHDPYDKASRTGGWP